MDMDRAPDAGSPPHGLEQTPPIPGTAALGLMLVATALVAALSATGVIPIGWTIAAPALSVAAYLIVAGIRGQRASAGGRPPIVASSPARPSSGGTASDPIARRFAAPEVAAEARALLADLHHGSSAAEVRGQAEALAHIYVVARDAGLSPEELAEIRSGFSAIAEALGEERPKRRRLPWRRTTEDRHRGRAAPG